MALIFNNTVYRNLQEQVYENTKDIEEFKPYSKSNVYTKEECDNKFKVYTHHISIGWVDEGEEPDYYNLRFDLIDNNSQAYTLDTLKDLLSTSIYIYNGYYEEGNDNTPDNARLFQSGIIYLNNNEIKVSVNYLFSDGEESYSSFVPTGLNDIVRGY